MLIVDAQVHLWGKGTTLPPHRAHPYLVDECILDMDAAGIDRAVLHPPSWDPDSGKLSVETVRAHPGRFAILGRLPLDDPESPSLIDSWKERPGTLGLRYTFLQPHQKSWPTDGTADWLWPAADSVPGACSGAPTSPACRGGRARGAACLGVPAARRPDRGTASPAQADHRPRPTRS